MIYHSTQSDDYLWYLIFVENKKRKKLKQTRIQSFSPFSMVGLIRARTCIDLNFERVELWTSMCFRIILQFIFISSRNNACFVKNFTSAFPYFVFLFQQPRNQPLPLRNLKLVQKQLKLSHLLNQRSQKPSRRSRFLGNWPNWTLLTPRTVRDSCHVTCQKKCWWICCRKDFRWAIN